VSCIIYCNGKEAAGASYKQSMKKIYYKISTVSSNFPTFSLTFSHAWHKQTREKKKDKEREKEEQRREVKRETKRPKKENARGMGHLLKKI
jgi:hypothetical protein